MLEQNALEVSLSSEPTPAEAPRGRGAKVKEPARAASSPADDIETLYLTHRNLLLYVACRKFQINDCDAENLIQEVFLSYLQVGTKIENIRAWLVAAICNASRHYWRAQARTEPLPENFGDQCDPGSNGIAERFALELSMQKALGYLPEKCRETLRLHYFEGRSAVEVAVEMETTTRYAEKLIHNCLKKVREIYLGMTALERR